MHTSRTHRRALAALLAAAALPACGPSLDAPTPADPAATLRTATRAMVGVPRDGYPDHPERVILYLTNRARTEPSKYNTEGGYTPTPPVRYDKKLSEAARFHAQHIVDASCWCADHSSCCQLEQVNGQVQCAGAAGGCGGTDASTRVRMWTTSYTGENMAQGYPTPAAAVDGWIHSPGHWANMNGSHTLLGPGHHQQRAWVQDFGSGGSTPPVAEDGVHFEDGGQVRFGITYYQPGTGGPRAIMTIVDGECHDLQNVAGKPEHGAFETARALGPGCHRYYFFVEDGDGDYHVYPEVGSFAVQVGAVDGECPFYSENRPADTCSPAGQSCMTGDTRACYTGPFGTRDVGICKAGAERCIGEQWQGTCRLEVLPEPAEICDNGLDDNCDGQTDEGCAQPMPDMGAAPDMGAVQPPAAPGDDEGCAAVGMGAGSGAPAPAPALWFAALGALMWGVRRGRKGTRDARV